MASIFFMGLVSARIEHPAVAGAKCVLTRRLFRNCFAAVAGEYFAPGALPYQLRQLALVIARRSSVGWRDHDPAPLREPPLRPRVALSRRLAVVPQGERGAGDAGPGLTFTATVSPTSPAAGVPDGTVVDVSSSPNPSTFGGSVTLTATLTSVGPPARRPAT
jgi:hypothetical protein